MSVSPSAASLPIIDLRRGAAAAQELDRACSEFGFFYLIGHELDPLLGERLLQLSREFFARDEAEKLRIHM